MSTNFCIGCGAPLETTQNFTAKKCSYCGLENSYIIPKREKNKPFFQRFFAFKKTIVPIRKKNFSQNEDIYRKRTKTIVDNQISQIQKKEINKNKKLREKSFQGIFRSRNIKKSKWVHRRRLIFMLIGFTTLASIGGYFSQRYPGSPLNPTYYGLVLNFKTWSAYEFEKNIEQLLEKDKYFEAARLASTGIKRYPEYYKLYLLRGIAGWKDNSRLSTLKDLNLGLSEFCKNKTSNYFCGWGYGCRAYLFYERNKRDAALKDAYVALSFEKNNEYRLYELAYFLFEFDQLKDFPKISNKGINLFEYIQKYNGYGLDQEQKKRLIDLYLMQAKYYFKSDPNKYKKKAIKVLDKLLRLDNDNYEALLLKNKISG